MRIEALLKEKEEMQELYTDKNPVETASWWSRLFFSWTTPVLEYSKKHQLDLNELGKVRPKLDVKVHKAKLEASWNHYKDSPSKDRLFKAVLRAYAWEYIVAILWNMLVCALQLA